MRVGIDSGDLDMALAEAVDQPDLPLVFRRLRLDRSVEALLAAAHVDEAKRAATLTAGDACDARQYQLRMEGRVALASGDTNLAIERLTAAVTLWKEAGYLGEESRTRRVLAQAYVAAGDQRAAEQELQSVLQIAAQTGGASTATGERLVTIMFADVRGYSELAREAAPPDLHDRIAALQRWAAHEVQRHHGVVDKFGGDAVMATFNISGATVDHAEHALRAAVGLRDRAVHLGLPIGVGIATGSAIVGRLAEGANVSVLGEATNLAARLQTQARAGEIILSEEAYRRLRGRVEAPSEQLELKGFKGLVTCYRLTRQ